MTETTPQCPEALYTPETDTVRRCTQSGPHDGHEDEHGTKWRDPMADQNPAHLDPFSENPADTMPQALTPDRLAEIRQREQAAIEGPWASDGAEIYRTFGGDICIDHWVGETLDIEDDELSNANAAFIAHARQDIPALLAELDRLRGHLDRRTEDVAFLERTTLPELRREIRHHQDGKRRWQARAEKAEAEHDELKKRATDLENASTCPSVAKLYGTHCALPIRHQGDHRDPEKRHFWSDEHAAPTS